MCGTFRTSCTHQLRCKSWLTRQFFFLIIFFSTEGANHLSEAMCLLRNLLTNVISSLRRSECSPLFAFRQTTRIFASARSLRSVTRGNASELPTKRHKGCSTPRNKQRKAAARDEEKDASLNVRGTETRRNARALLLFPAHSPLGSGGG